MGVISGRYFGFITALRTSDEYKVVTPANWQPGQSTMVPPPQTHSQLISRYENQKDSGLECNDWFWCYNINPNLSDSSPVMAIADSSSFLSASQNANYNVDELTSAVESLINRMGTARPVGTRQQQQNQFLLLKLEMDQLENKIGLLEDQVEGDYRARRITWEKYKNIDRILDSLDDRLDRAENILKRTFGIND